MFDDQFNLVDDNSGVKQVKGTPDELQTLAVDKMPITQSVFLYVYTSNETEQDVFFDNVTLAVISGPLLEETHYYPFGLAMSGISSNALKGSNYPTNRNKFNGIELNSDLDLYSYEAHYRNLDPQLGRWWQIDPKLNEAISPYAAMDNNPIRYCDFLGDTTIAGAGFWRNAWEGLKDGGRATVSWVKSLGTAEGIGSTLDGIATMSPFNVDQGSVASRAQMIDNTVNYVADIPNKTSDQIGHDLGYGTEKVVETVVATKGAGMLKNALSGTKVAAVAEGAANVGSDIVGTAHSNVLPTQDWINPQQVRNYEKALRSGQKIEAIDAYKANGKIYIENGHHRYVAGQNTGIPVPMRVSNTSGPIGFPNWLKVTYETPH